MRSQWDCLLQNSGIWAGSFTQVSPQGTQLEDTPTIVSLTPSSDQRTMRQVVRRLKQPPEELVLEYSTLARGVLFLENGAFSQGALQYGPFSEFGAELGLIETHPDGTPGDRRLRIVHLFNKASELAQITLIREHREGTTPTSPPPLTVEALLGEWHGEAITVYPDWRTPTTMTSTLRLHRDGQNRLVQQLAFGTSGRSLTSSATINGAVLTFDQGTPPVQVVLLPGGASATSPTQIVSRQSFFLEAGWLLHPTLRQRLIRTYDSTGEWVSLTLVTERKVADSPA